MDFPSFSVYVTRSGSVAALFDPDAVDLPDTGTM
jgi:hypothetical protein